MQQHLGGYEEREDDSVGLMGDDRLDEFAREPDHALVLGLHARARLRDLAADVDGEPQRQQQRQQQVDAPAQG